MKRLFLIFLLAFVNLLSLDIFGQTSAGASLCQKFKTGTFVTKMDNGTEIEMVRTATEQTERFENGSIKLKVKWVNDCEYHLTIVSFSDNPSHELIGQTLKVTITRVEDNSYYYSVKMGEKVIAGNNKITKVR